MYPLYTTGSIDTDTNYFYAILLGMAFGFILERGGFGSSKNIAPIFYFRDLRVSNMMVSAILTAATWMIIAVYNGWVDFNQVFIPSTYVWAYVVGGALFGLGMVMAGWCPGTSVVGIARGKADAFVFALGLLVGMYIYFIAYPNFFDFANMSNLGRFTIDKLVGGDLYTAFFVTVVIGLGLETFMYIMKKIRDKKGDY